MEIASTGIIALRFEIDFKLAVENLDMIIIINVAFIFSALGKEFVSSFISQAFSVKKPVPSLMEVHVFEADFFQIRVEKKYTAQCVDIDKL